MSRVQLRAMLLLAVFWRWRRSAQRFLSDDQLADYSDWFDNQRRLRALLAELEELSLAIVEADRAGRTNAEHPFVTRWRLATERMVSGDS